MFSRCVIDGHGRCAVCTSHDHERFVCCVLRAARLDGIAPQKDGRAEDIDASLDLEMSTANLTVDD